MKNIFFTDESVKWHITGSISENLTDSDLESSYKTVIFNNALVSYLKILKIAEFLLKLS